MKTTVTMRDVGDVTLGESSRLDLSGVPADEPPPPKNPGFVTATVDGKEVVVKPGTTVIEAAKSVGIEIPYYCYHKRLSIAANCRMCLVEMSNAPMGKLMPACQMPVGEGVTVKTDTPRVKEQQRAVLEFILLNHPVDCSICDQAGECKLQDYYMKYDRQPSRLDVPKVQKGKRVQLGPTVTLDQERCILCTRCVRFMREVAKAPQLGVAERGNESFITTFPGQPLDSKYSGNVVDICPVGALTSTDFRFRGRVWFMSSARSVCTGCARGCNTFLDYLKGTFSAIGAAALDYLPKGGFVLIVVVLTNYVLRFVKAIFKAVLAEGADDILGWRSPNWSRVSI